jgi:hypothetical protein
MQWSVLRDEPGFIVQLRHLQKSGPENLGAAL